MEHKIFTEDEIRAMRHPLEKVFLYIQYAIFGIIILGLVLASLFKNDVYEWFKESYISDYREENVIESTVTDEEVFELLGEDKKSMLKYITYFYFPVLFLLPVAWFLLMVYVMGKMYGWIVWNGARMTKESHPEIFSSFERLAKQLNFKDIPPLFVVNGNGLLNAYAAQFRLRKYGNFCVLYSDLIDAYMKKWDIQSLEFVMAHELGHMKFKHVSWWVNLFTFIWNTPPFNYILWLPLSRAREYTCDRVGMELSGQTNGKALMIIGVGKYGWHENMDPKKHVENMFNYANFWVTLSNFFVDHPVVIWRVHAIQNKTWGGIFFRKTK